MHTLFKVQHQDPNIVVDYAIGDIQGCYDELMRLLEHINFNDREDRLWFVGDLVNRGPKSLEVLRFIKNLPIKPVITLGNHDLHYLVRLFCQNNQYAEHDTLEELLSAPDTLELAHWLRQQSMIYYDPDLQIVMSHAGIAPIWNLQQALQLAHELETVLRSEQYIDFLTHMYGNEPNYWSNDLQGIDRLRVIYNYLTRMRLCDINGQLILSHTDHLPHLYPWFDVPNRCNIAPDIIFGHWAALNGQCSAPNIYAIDTGCAWGRHLTALRLQDKQRFFVSG